MTIKWVKTDPLVMNGEPFCYGTRLTVRNLLEMRANGLTPADMLANHPELRRVGIAEVFKYAAENKDRYPEFFENSALRGPVSGPTTLPTCPSTCARCRESWSAESGSPVLRLIPT